MERDDIDEVIAREKSLHPDRDSDEKMILYVRTYGILTNREVLTVLGINWWTYPVEKVKIDTERKRRLDESFTVISRAERDYPDFMDRDKVLRLYRTGGSILQRMKQGKAYEVIAAMSTEEDY